MIRNIVTNSYADIELQSTTPSEFEATILKGMYFF